jgi:hypothetical protein
MMRSNTPADSPIGRPASGPFEVSEQDFRAAATRAETVGSLLRPGPVAEAVRADRGQPSEAVAKLLDDAVREAIRLQEQAGLDVITDGEMRRFSWAQTPRYLDCFERRPDTATLDWRGGAGGPRPDPGMASRAGEPVSQVLSAAYEDMLKPGS